ncbi:hypothetical protein OAO87_01970 [bacterium]|nr:hypothetical protein [bacterium]
MLAVCTAYELDDNRNTSVDRPHETALLSTSALADVLADAGWDDSVDRKLYDVARARFDAAVVRLGATPGRCAAMGCALPTTRLSAGAHIVSTVADQAKDKDLGRLETRAASHAVSSATPVNDHHWMASRLNKRLKTESGVVVRTLEWDGSNVSDAHLLSPELERYFELSGEEVDYSVDVNYSATWLRYDLPVSIYMFVGEAKSGKGEERSRHGVVASANAELGCAWPTDAVTMTGYSPMAPQFWACAAPDIGEHVRQQRQAASAGCIDWPTGYSPKATSWVHSGLCCATLGWMAAAKQAFANSSDSCEQSYGVTFNEVQLHLQHQPHILDAVFYASFAPPTSGNTNQSVSEWAQLKQQNCLRARELASHLDHGFDTTHPLRDRVVQLNLPYEEAEPYVVKGKGGTYDWDFANGPGGQREHVATFGPPVC